MISLAPRGTRNAGWPAQPRLFRHFISWWMASSEMSFRPYTSHAFIATAIPTSGRLRPGSVSTRLPWRLHACLMLPVYQERWTSGAPATWWLARCRTSAGGGSVAEPRVVVAHREQLWWLLAEAAQLEHRLYDHTRRLVAKTGLIDFRTWYLEASPEYSPWGGEDSAAVVTAAESATERQLSLLIIAAGPPFRRLR